MSYAMMAHLGYAAPQMIQIDPALLALSTCIDPAPNITATSPLKKNRNRKAEGGKRGPADPDKAKKPRKRPTRTPNPAALGAAAGGEVTEAYFPPIGALATANTLGRYTKLASKCSRHTKCLSCIQRGEECVWADGPPIQDIPKSAAPLENELRRLDRLIKVLSARYVTREASLAAQHGRPPRPVPTLADIPLAPPPLPPPPPPPSAAALPKRRKKADSRNAGVHEDIAVDFQAYSDYFNRHASHQDSVLEDAQALLALATPVNGVSPFAVRDNQQQQPQPPPTPNEGEGVGLEISAAAALAAAQAARHPLPFSKAAPPAETGSRQAARQQRPPLPRSATTSAVHGGVPTLPLLEQATSAGTNAATEIEAYRSLAVQMGLDPSTGESCAAAQAVPDSSAYVVDSAFEPVVESSYPPFEMNETYTPAPLYYLPPPVPSTSTLGPRAPTAADYTLNALSSATFFYPSSPPSSRMSRHRVAAMLEERTAALRLRQDTSWQSDREAKHRQRFDRAAEEKAIASVQVDASPHLATTENARLGRGGNVITIAGNEDPMLLAPIQKHADTNALLSLPQLPPPPRRASWLVSPILAPLSLPTPPSQRPSLSVDAAGAFAKTVRDGSLSNPASGLASGNNGGGGGGGGSSAISALFWRGLPSAVTPLRSALASADEAGLRPFGSTIRLWRGEGEDGAVTSPGLLAADDEDDERFEPRAAGAHSPMPPFLPEPGVGRGPAGGGDEWARFQPRAANQAERTDFIAVAEEEAEELDNDEEDTEERPATGATTSDSATTNSSADASRSQTRSAGAEEEEAVGGPGTNGAFVGA
ncbi:hypothetical protein JCM10908_005090 [Rhodotorula pacifica]|uniref:uncharacterized protein n=1 Tax=Rhodotorula pacifica TaxID=1495444 RepID=UPI003181B919